MSTCHPSVWGWPPRCCHQCLGVTSQMLCPVSGSDLPDVIPSVWGWPPRCCPWCLGLTSQMLSPVSGGDLPDVIPSVWGWPPRCHPHGLGLTSQMSSPVSVCNLLDVVPSVWGFLHYWPTNQCSSFEWNKRGCTYVHLKNLFLVDVVTLLYK